MPTILNPLEGIWASANNRPAAPCRHFLAREWIDDSRYRRILELLRSRPRHSVADFQRMHADVISLPAQDITRRLCGGIRVGRESSDPLRALVGWDGTLTTDSTAAAIYQVFRLQLLEHVHGDLPAPLLDLVLGKGINEVLSFISVFHNRSSSYLLAKLDALLASGQGHVISKSLEATVAWLRTKLGPDPSAWQWGRLHQARFNHALGRAAPALDLLLHLNRGPIPIGGDLDTLAQSGVSPWRPYDAATFMVSYRQIFDVGNWDEGLFILPTGQSGHPGSPHYDDMLGSWRRVEYRQLLFSRSVIERATVSTVHLRPRN
jgi:penicillin amidase